MVGWKVSEAFRGASTRGEERLNGKASILILGRRLFGEKAKRGCRDDKFLKRS